jgi:hypothetical protein
MIDGRRNRKHFWWYRTKVRDPHLTWFNKPKRSYSTREVAMRVVREGTHRYPVEPYECDCGWWHLGSPHRVSYLWTLPERREDYLIEIGVRAANCLRVENIKNPAFRVKQITARFNAIQRRVYKSDREVCA